MTLKKHTRPQHEELLRLKLKKIIADLQATEELLQLKLERITVMINTVAWSMKDVVRSIEETINDEEQDIIANVLDSDNKTRD